MKAPANFVINSILLFFLSFGVVSKLDAQSAENLAAEAQINDSQIAAARLRTLYAERDFEYGYKLGQNLSARFPENVELQAWFILNMARNEMSAQAVKTAKTLVENNKQNAWAWFALAHAEIRDLKSREAFAAAEKALELEPNDEEFIFLYDAALFSRQRYDDVSAWLDKNSSKIKDQSRLWYNRAEAQYYQSKSGKNSEALKKQSLANFAKARELNPESVNANLIYGVYLNLENRFAEALPALKKAVALAPKVAQIRQQYWKALLNGQPNKSDEQRKSEAASEANNFLRLRSDSPDALFAVASFYGQELEMPDKQKEIERLILKNYSQSAAAERILIAETRTFDYIGEDKKVDEKKKRQLIQMLKDFINRPKHYNENYLGLVSARLFYQVENDQNISNAELLQIAEKISEKQRYETAEAHAMIVFGLTERKMFSEAENFVKIGFQKVEREIESQREDGTDEKKIQENSNVMNAVLHNAKGRLYFKENRLDEAAKELRQAIELNNQISSFYDNLGQVSEAENDLEKAEDAYINAYSTFYGKENPHLEKLRALFQKRGGSLSEFGAYFEKVKLIERDRRKERILAAKISEREPIVPFTLKNLNAKSVSTADLKGKVVVVNIWGTWCAPCVSEMPDFQQLHKKYLADKNVVILSVNNDGDLKLVKKFMAERKYDFTVLEDEKYLQTAEVNSFPTTWFIDREGKIAFVKIGASDKLLEEFGWRIEELKK